MLLVCEGVALNTESAGGGGRSTWSGRWGWQESGGRKPLKLQ